jgi:hypothetical protein
MGAVGIWWAGDMQSRPIAPLRNRIFAGVPLISDTPSEVVLPNVVLALM